jgi:hypothetical protein
MRNFHNIEGSKYGKVYRLGYAGGATYRITGRTNGYMCVPTMQYNDGITHLFTADTMEEISRKLDAIAAQRRAAIACDHIAYIHDETTGE